MKKGRTYDVRDIKIMVKDVRDPYVIAYSIGENGEFYDIK